MNTSAITLRAAVENAGALMGKKPIRKGPIMAGSRHKWSGDEKKFLITECDVFPYPMFKDWRRISKAMRKKFKGIKFSPSCCRSMHKNIERMKAQPKIKRSDLPRPVIEPPPIGWNFAGDNLEIRFT